MTTSEQMRRLVALEADARIRRAEASLEANLKEMRPRVEEAARDIECTLDEVFEETRKGILRIAEIGQEAYEIEAAAEFRCTLEELRSGEVAARMDREWAEWKERERERRAKVVHWQGGVLYRGGVPVPGGGPMP